MAKRIDTITPSQDVVDAALMLDLGFEIEPSAAPATNVTPDSPLPLAPTLDAATTISGTAGSTTAMSLTQPADAPLPTSAVDTNALGRVINLSRNDDIFFLSDLEELYDNNITVNGLAGKDTIIGYFANDKLFGDAGDDVLQGGAGNDNLDGGEDNDLLIGGAGADKLLGGSGIDTVSYEDAPDQV